MRWSGGVLAAVFHHGVETHVMDIVDRLRAPAVDEISIEQLRTAALMAADEIERLRTLISYALDALSDDDIASASLILMRH
jgi:hypothetical protein